MSTSAAVITAVRERVERLGLDLPKAQQESVNAFKLYERAAQYESAIKKELEELIEFLDREGQAVAAPAVANSVSISANNQMLLRVRALLADGRSRMTREIYEELLRQGQVFTAMNPVQRLSQLLSASDWFIADRTKGWTLAQGENPAGAGSSGARTSVEDEEL